MKYGFVFAGQGQQFLYMGQDLCVYPSVQKIYDQAKDILGYDVLNLGEEKLNQTQFTQPALFTLGVALDRLLKEKGIEPSVVCGLSLGEYNALVSSGALDFETALRIIQKRAALMASAFLPNETGMAACLRTSQEAVEEALKDSEIEICNVNTPTQIVIGGKKDALEIVLRELKEKKIRAISLKVSTVSHMSLLKSQSEKLKTILDDVSFSKPKVKFINNVDACFQEDNFSETLARQISEKTQLALSIEKMIKEGVDTIFEVGPKNTIVKFIKEIDPTIPTQNVYDLSSLQEVVNG